MAKDRTRHARRREPQPERAGVSLYDMVAQDMGRVLVGFAEGTWHALFGFADAVSSAVSDCAEMCRRLTDDAD